MIWHKHSDLEGRHAFLGASNHHWLNYDLEKLAETYKSAKAKERGTILHEHASRCIKLKTKLADEPKALNHFVNESIDFKMESEQVLCYSGDAFGTADAISFRNNLLRISDLKTGVSKPSMNQLMIYAALFCLEYKKKPDKIKIELRIYQNDDIDFLIPDPEIIAGIMDKMVLFDDYIKKIDNMEA